MGEVKSVFVDSLIEDEQVVSAFLCQSKSSFVGKTGKPYLSLVLADKTGNVDAKLWDNVEELTAGFNEGDFVKVKAKVTSYNGRLQLRVGNIRALDGEELDPGDFFPTSSFNTDEMISEMREIVQSLPNEHIKQLILSFMDDEDFLKKYRRAPAAKVIHHSFLGGLLEHSLSLARLAIKLCDHYPQIDLSLLISGVFFHDIGKLRELHYDRSTGYTDEGRLIGHITIGIEMLNEHIAAIPDFPSELKMLITHLILAHHGTLEFGSPKRPKIIEAHVLSVIDDLDARMNSFQDILDKETKKERWTGYQRLYDRYLYRWQGPEILEDDKEDSAAPAASKPPTEGSSSNNSAGGNSFSNSIRIGGKKPSEEDSGNLDLFSKQSK